MKREVIDAIVRELSQGRDFEIVTRDGQISMLRATEDVYEVRLRLHRPIIKIEIKHRNLLMGPASERVSHILEKLSEGAASLRGEAIREMVDGDAAFDFFAGLDKDAEHQCAERLACKFQELADKMMKRAQETQ